MKSVLLKRLSLYLSTALMLACTNDPAEIIPDGTNTDTITLSANDTLDSIPLKSKVEEMAGPMDSVLIPLPSE
jgi:hypothetical protein